jgi:hypothetical protein
MGPVRKADASYAADIAGPPQDLGGHAVSDRIHAPNLPK